MTRRPGHTGRAAVRVVFVAALAAWAGCGEVKSVAPDAPVPDAPVPDAPVADAAGEPDAMPCVSGDVNAVDPATGSCYMLFLGAESWTSARILCEALAGDTHLVTIHSDAESAFVTEMIGTYDVWIGANDLAAPGTWVWVDGAPFDYQNWDPGQPDSGGEHCARADGDVAGRWHDDSCGDPWRFMCERP
jgi:hypothetical protein